MKKFGLVLAALGAIIVAAPSIASAETVVIKRGGYHGHHHGYGDTRRFLRCQSYQLYRWYDRGTQ